MSNRNRKRNKKEKYQIKNERECGWYIEAGFLDNDNLTENDIYSAIDELHAYISLEGVSFDFGNGLIEINNFSSESTYIEFGLDILYSYVGYDYDEREYIDVLMNEMGLSRNGCVIGYCDCALCDSESAYIEYIKNKIKYLNRHRRNPLYKKSRDLERGRNIYRNRFLKVYFNNVDCNCCGLLCNCDYKSDKSLLRNGYYKYIDNRARCKSLKKSSNKRIRNVLKRDMLNYNNSLYKRVFDYYNLFD